jgi:NAD(P)-dependent dehydrogenase (short-subunit alcohol dehydrogenase family)
MGQLTGGSVQQLQGRVAVVTGAASGIGLAMATRFAAAGMKLVLADIEAAALRRRRHCEQAAQNRVATGRRDVGCRVDALADAAYAAFGAVACVQQRRVAAPAHGPGNIRPATGTGSGMNFGGVLNGVRNFRTAHARGR